jgi:hypothetical protein
MYQSPLRLTILILPQIPHLRWMLNLRRLKFEIHLQCRFCATEQSDRVAAICQRLHPSCELSFLLYAVPLLAPQCLDPPQSLQKLASSSLVSAVMLRRSLFPNREAASIAQGHVRAVLVVVHAAVRDFGQIAIVPASEPGKISPCHSAKIRSPGGCHSKVSVIFRCEGRASRGFGSPVADAENDRARKLAPSPSRNLPYCTSGSKPSAKQRRSCHGRFSRRESIDILHCGLPAAWPFLARPASGMMPSCSALLCA